MKISVCIPAYKNAAFLRRNLDALVGQTYKDFEVVVSDDSPDESVAEIVAVYQPLLNIVYLKNSPAKGSPANWNFAIRHAKGEYLKLIHDDDWLAADTSLQQYLDCLDANPNADFCFSAFNNVNIETTAHQPVFCSNYHQHLLRKTPYNLFKRNFIGPPSVVFLRNEPRFLYDENLKWLVDFEGYIRFLQDRQRFVYLNAVLVNIGLSEEQVTSYTQHDAGVVLPESLYFLEKHGTAILDNVFVYDYFWRMLRNFSITSVEDITAIGWVKPLPARIFAMIRLQNKIPRVVLRLGLFSKSFMFISRGFTKKLT